MNGITVVLFTLVLSTISAETFGLFGVLFDVHYDQSGKNFSYIEVDTISIDPETGEGDSLYRNVIYPTPITWAIYKGVSTVDTKRNVLYFALDYYGGEYPISQEIYGTDLVNKRAVSTIVVPLKLVTSLIYDEKNDKLLVGGFYPNTPTEDNSGVLLAYSFTNFQTEVVYQWKGFQIVLDKVLDTTRDLLYFVASDREIKLGTIDLKTKKTISLVPLSKCSKNKGYLVGDLRFDPEVGLYSIGAMTFTNATTQFYWMTITSEAECEFTLITSLVGRAGTYVYDAKTKKVYLQMNGANENNIMTFDTVSKKILHTTSVKINILAEMLIAYF